MGKRKQKVQWSKVDGFDWNQDEQNGPLMEVMKGETGPGASSRTRRSSAPGWTSSLAPRFERRAAAEADQKHIYYEGELCEAEELPNGFTKIRSKNLDILFKRDYYEQRLAAQRLISEGLTKLQNSETEVDSCHKILDEDNEDVIDTVPTIESMESFVQLDAEFTSQTFDNIDLNEIPEFKPMNIDIKTTSCDIDSGHTSPFYGNYPPYHPQEHTEGNQYGAPPRPNLYLYSPSNNTLIPCDEIIIPNPVMSPEGPVYSGPTNIYLAYPVQGQDGRGYITQPFLPPGSAGSYMSQDSGSYSPSISYDGSNHYSTTPHTPSSGEDSGSSTQPNSPPPLVNYHHTNWINQDQTPPTPIQKDLYCPHQTVDDYDQQPLEKFTEKLESSNPATPSIKNDPVSYIPGLTQDSTNKKSQKRRKKKTKTAILKEHRASTSSDSEVQQICAAEECYSSHKVAEQMSEDEFDEMFPEVTVDLIHEIHLTDDLAECLVNPPTDPEGSDDDQKVPTNISNDHTVEENNGSNEINTINESSDNIKDERIIENTEVFGIIGNIKEKSLSDIKTLTKPKVYNDEISHKRFSSITNLHSDNEIEEIKDNSSILTNEAAHDDIITKIENIVEVIELEIVEACKINEHNINKDVSEQIFCFVNDFKEQNSLDSLNSQPKVQVEAVEEQSHINSQSINLNSKIETDTVDQENILLSKNSKNKLTNKNRKTKSKVKVQPVLKSSLKVDNSKHNEDISPDVIVECPVTIPKSYSSVIKSNLVTVPNNPTSISSISTVSSDSIASPSTVGAVPMSCPLSPNLRCQVAKTRSEQESDNNWENIPLSGSKSENWKKTSKKRKHKNKNITFQDSPLTHEMPDLEVVEQQEKSKTPVEVEKAVVIEEDLEEDDTNGEQEQKKLRKRKKKFGSVGPEEINGVHRVVICDEQIYLQNHQEGRGSASPLSPSLVDKFNPSGYSDFLVVSELGSGISRGCMNLGRLYQGKYVAPERTDGLIHQPGDEESVKEDESDQHLNCLEASIIDSTIIDLD